VTFNSKVLLVFPGGSLETLHFGSSLRECQKVAGVRAVPPVGFY